MVEQPLAFKGFFTAPLLLFAQATPEALSAADRRVPLSAALDGVVPNQHAAIGLFAADRRVFSVCWSGGLLFIKTQ